MPMEFKCAIKLQLYILVFSELFIVPLVQARDVTFESGER